MTRFVVRCSVVLLSVSALAQSPAVTPTSASAPSAAASTETTEVSQFQRLENNWSESINSRDQYGLELVLSLADIIGNEDKTLHLDQRVVTVRMLGDTAVANGTYLLHHKTPGGVVDEKGVFTHVFERIRGGWVCINSQRTSVRADAPGKQKKQSTAEFPFHIPLFSKSDKSAQ
jgi:Domain of unknown function (DUF4440)